MCRVLCEESQYITYLSPTANPRGQQHDSRFTCEKLRFKEAVWLSCCLTASENPSSPAQAPERIPPLPSPPLLPSLLSSLISMRKPAGRTDIMGSMVKWDNFCLTQRACLTLKPAMWEAKAEKTP